MSTPSAPPARKPPALPFGFVAIIAVLVLSVIGVLLVATGGDDAPDDVRRSTGIDGVQVTSNLSANHTSFDGERVAYPDRDTRPPVGGNHNPVWQDCRAYSAPIAPENAVHSLEHGAVWLTYRPGLDQAEVAVLDGFTSTGAGQDYVLVSPYTGQQSPVVLTAWGRQLSVDSATDPRVREFVELYADGPQTREKGAGCDSPLTLTGDAPFVTSDAGDTFTPSTSTRTVSASGEID